MQRFLLASLSLLIGAVHARSQAQFTPLGDLAGGTFNSTAYDTNADGSVVVGASNAGSALAAFRWTASAGMVSLGGIPGGGALSNAQCVSADGAVVAGFGAGPLGNEAFRWTASGGMIGLGDLPGGNTSSYGYAISADGATVVGASSSTVSTLQWVEAFRWTASAGMVPLGVLGGMPESLAFAVNSDGSVIAGRSGGRAFRWTAATGMLDLGGIVGGTGSGQASGMNALGTVIVGHGGTSLGTEAFRWTSASGAIGLGDLPGGTYYSSANATSADGNTIVGYANFSSGLSDAFLWSPSLGMVNLHDYLVSLGVTGVGGWSLRRAEGVSADGNTIVGWGLNPSGSFEAWRVTFAPNRPSSYCSAGTTSNGCAAAISFSGTPSASGASAFSITVASVEGQKQGLIFYGIDNSGFTPQPWGQGSSLLCVKAPTQRTSPQSSGGGFNQCNGVLALDWAAFVVANPSALGAPWSPGDVVYAQAWFRDPPSAKTTNLSNALEFTLFP